MDTPNTEQERNEKFGSLAGLSAGVIAGARVGTIAIPIPVVGTFVGALFGGVVGSEIGKRVGSAAISGVSAFLDNLAAPPPRQTEASEEAGEPGSPSQA